ncbi:N-acyl amino acid synthase FeeM domain-containing protein [Thaumasiovibrio subtropicus]|uniref:N-acyl amino acid synthase FeeM domain-containing protein n=1 Tax=Thaumasiovibrio subtropicus TaxID=1891207 RepID=UPI000B34F947|nr:hypothetical protein [Thaumasiovibrio subtropicus]
MKYGTFKNIYCQTEEEKITAYNIRYQAYTHVGFNPTDTHGLFTDPHDEAPNNFTFLLKDNGKPIGTTRLSIVHRPFGWIDVPSRAGFEDEFLALEQEYDAIIEAGRLAVLPDLRGSTPTVIEALQCAPYSFMSKFGRTAIVCASGKRHLRYYQRNGMKSMCGFAPRPNAAIELTLMVKDCDFERHITQCGMKQSTIDNLIPTIPKEKLDNHRQIECLV